MAGSTHPSRSPGTPGDPSRPRDAENCPSAVTKTPRTARLFRRCIHVTMVLGPYRAPNPCSASGVLWKTHEPFAVPPQTLASRASRGGHSLPGSSRDARDARRTAARPTIRGPMRVRIFLVLCGLLALAIWAVGVDAYVNEDALLGTVLILVGGVIVAAVVGLWRQGREGAEDGVLAGNFEFFGAGW